MQHAPLVLWLKPRRSKTSEPFPKKAALFWGRVLRFETYEVSAVVESAHSTRWELAICRWLVGEASQHSWLFDQFRRSLAGQVEFAGFVLGKRDRG